MDFIKQYEDKRKTPDELANMIQPGMHIRSDIALTAPPAILTAINKRAEEGTLTGAYMSNSLLLFPLSCYQDPKVSANLKPTSLFSDSIARKSVSKGLCDVFPFYYQDGMEITEKYLDTEVFCAVVSPMDKHGYFSFGTTTSCIPAFVNKASIILLEVNENMPRAINAPQIHISQVSGLCENNIPLIVLPESSIDEKSRIIGQYIAEQIPDGATLQLGIGMIPDAVGSELKNKKHLGIHTEMLTDSMVKLLECGAADNSLKPIHTGYSVATFAFGSKRIYDFIDDNPTVKMLTADHVNNSSIIAQHPNFMSVNGALEVDFWGQVAAESVGTYHVSGTGGQFDFVRGATHSVGGKSFIALTSTTRDENESRIVPTLKPGSIVTTSKNDVDYIVTEYGIVKLRGASIGERAKKLISIAHPKFREQLTFEAKKLNLVI